LVVVAIIALLISILLPSLSKARAQARTTLCLSRIAQQVKAMIMYGSDFDETPPFIGVGFKNCGEDETYTNLGVTEMAMAVEEKWLIPNMTAVWRDENWDALIGTVNEPKVENGTLFPYTRFAALYRCPEFERIANKTQNLFNYTRTVLGRKLLSTVLNDPGAEDELHPGPIMKFSSIYAPAAMFMMLDEQWDFHCAGKYEDPGCLDSMSGMWMCADSMHAIAGDMIGSYHGTKGRTIPWNEIMPAAEGAIGYYDGHAGTMRDPWPWRNSTITPKSAGQAALIQRVLGDFQTGKKVLDPLMMSIYAQRGVTVTDEFIAGLISGLGG